MWTLITHLEPGAEPLVLYMGGSRGGDPGGGGGGGGVGAGTGAGSAFVASDDEMEEPAPKLTCAYKQCTKNAVYVDPLRCKQHYGM